MASRGLNKVILIGNLGKPFEVKYTQSGKAVASASLAVGDGKEETEWFNLVAWDKAAENLAQFTGKGSKIYIEGRLQTRKWEQDGQQRSKVEVIISTFLLLDKRQEAGETQYEPAPRALAVVSDDDLPF